MYLSPAPSDCDYYWLLDASMLGVFWSCSKLLGEGVHSGEGDKLTAKFQCRESLELLENVGYCFGAGNANKVRWFSHIQKGL